MVSSFQFVYLNFAFWICTYVLYLITLVTLITLRHQLAHMLKFLDTLLRFIIIIIIIRETFKLRKLVQGAVIKSGLKAQVKGKPTQSATKSAEKHYFIHTEIYR